ncbi:MAG: Do family serine endopeptidase [Pseudomonadota bacterium]
MARALAALMLGMAVVVASAHMGVAQTQDRPVSFADLAEQISDSVVNITTRTTVASAAQPGPGPQGDTPFDDFFRDFMNRDRDQQPRRGSARGSGFVFSPDGFFVTNNLVIESADEILFEFFSGFELPAEVVGTDPNTDVALLKVEPDEPLPYVEFGDSEIVRVGDWVMAMGNPLGQGFSVSAGIVSAKSRALQGSYDDFIQTDAAINRGNSGGPLFNMDGEVVGVNTAILSPNGGSIGIGFAMSSAVVTRVVDQLQQFGETRRGWLGVSIQDVDDQLAEALGLAAAQGALITDVPEGPASQAGLQSGDVIVTFDGVEVEDTRGLVRQVGATAVGKTVEVEVYRDGDSQMFDVTLGRRETAQAVPAAMPAPEEPTEAEILGMTIAVLTDEMREEMELPDTLTGLVVANIDESSDAFEKGLRAGDVITEVAQRSVSSLSDLEDRIEAGRDAGRKSLLLLVRRGNDPRFVALSLEE